MDVIGFHQKMERNSNTPTLKREHNRSICSGIYLFVQILRCLKSKSKISITHEKSRYQHLQSLLFFPNSQSRVYSTHSPIITQMFYTNFHQIPAVFISNDAFFIKSFSSLI